MNSERDDLLGRLRWQPTWLATLLFSASIAIMSKFISVCVLEGFSSASGQLLQFIGFIGLAISNCLGVKKNEKLFVVAIAILAFGGYLIVLPFKH